MRAAQSVGQTYASAIVAMKCESINEEGDVLPIDGKFDLMMMLYGLMVRPFRKVKASVDATDHQSSKAWSREWGAEGPGSVFLKRIISAVSGSQPSSIGAQH
jgi:hypothetical protein